MGGGVCGRGVGEGCGGGVWEVLGPGGTGGARTGVGAPLDVPTGNEQTIHCSLRYLRHVTDAPVDFPKQ